MLKLTEAEANELVATKVMRWTKDGCRAAGCDEWHLRTAQGLEPIEDSEDWNPCSDPAATAMLRAKLAERAAWHLIWRTSVKRFHFSMFLIDINKPDVAAEAETEGRAVVLCAFKSVGVEAEIIAS